MLLRAYGYEFLADWDKNSCKEMPFKRDDNRFIKFSISYIPVLVMYNFSLNTRCIIYITDRKSLEMARAVRITLFIIYDIVYLNCRNMLNADVLVRKVDTVFAWKLL